MNEEQLLKTIHDRMIKMMKEQEKLSMSMNRPPVDNRKVRDEYGYTMYIQALMDVYEMITGRKWWEDNTPFDLKDH